MSSKARLFADQVSNLITISSGGSDFITPEILSASVISASTSALETIRDGVGENLNTLSEISQAINDDDNFYNTIDGTYLDKNSASITYLTKGSASTTYATKSENGLSFRNMIINGAMQIWQRGTSGTSGYVADRWLGVDTTSISRSTDAPSGFRHSLSFANNSATFPIIDQRIESLNAYRAVGSKVTVSLWAKNVTGTDPLNVQILTPNASDNFSSTTLVGTITLSSNPSSSWTRYSGTLSQVIPSAGANGLLLRVYRGNSAASTTLITGVQLEVGEVATPFEFKTYAQDYAECTRYYKYLKYLGNELPFQRENTSTNAYFYNYFPLLPMRSGPTLIATLILPDNRIHKPIVRWDGVSDGPSATTLQDGYTVQIYVRPSTNDGGSDTIYVYGYILELNSEL